MSLSNPRPLPAILLGGAIAGVLDISYAIAMGMRAGGTPARTLKSVASGLLGRPAFQGGWEIAALGLALHFIIAFGWAVVYYVASRRIAILRDSPWICGVLFGALVYLSMNRVVVPLSAAPFELPMRTIGLFVHMFLIGLPIALSVRRYSK